MSNIEKALDAADHRETHRRQQQSTAQQKPKYDKLHRLSLLHGLTLHAHHGETGFRTVGYLLPTPLEIERGWEKDQHVNPQAQ